MKKIITLALALIMVISMVACTAEDGKISDTDTSEEISDVIESTEDTTAEESVEEDITAPAAPTGPVATILTEVQTLMGETYLPSMDLDAEMLESMFGIKADSVKEYVAQVPMIGFHVDKFIAVEANEGMADGIEETLNAYLTNEIENNVNYPINIPKLEAARVHRNGDFVFFVSLGGAIPMDIEEDEAAIKQYAQETNQKVIDKIDEILAK